MVLIPAGEFTMGDTFSEISSNELPLHPVYVSAFYMEKYEVSYALWQTVRAYALTNGYSFSNPGEGKATNHPVNNINWYDSVKWCNARSQQEGLTPVYYLDASFTQLFSTGETTNIFANWGAGGYRLPTEAEWEKAARGGLSGLRFPWGNTISWSQANYNALPPSQSGPAYDVNPTSGVNPTFETGDPPYTSPVGYFATNGYGLYDMAGNVSEWCWDWLGAYSSGLQTNPRGPSAGTWRELRGGDWEGLGGGASICRTAYRYDPFVKNILINPNQRRNYLGFRCVRIGDACLPGILSQPVSSTNLLGSTAAFSVVVTGDEPLSYQWRKDGLNLYDGFQGDTVTVGGATTATLSLTNLQTTSSDGYDVVVTNICGSVTSAVANLTVVYYVLPAGIFAHPQSRTNVVGSTATFTVVPTGTFPLALQWRKNGIALNNKTNATLTLSNVQLGDAADYDVVVTNPWGSATSTAATLTVVTTPSIATPPQSQISVVGSTATFNVNAAGTAPLSYQWRKYGANLPGATGATLALTGVTEADAGDYAVMVTNNYGSVVSAAARLTVLTNPPPFAFTNIAYGSAGFQLAVGFSGACLGDRLVFEVSTNLIDWAPIEERVYGGVPIAFLDFTATNLLARFYRTRLVPPTANETAPVITTHPASRTNLVGTAASFTVNAACDLLAYQWLKNESILPGATSANLLFPSVQPLDAGDYRVVVSNPYGAVTSAVATLTVIAPSKLYWIGGTAAGLMSNTNNYRLLADGTGAAPSNISSVDVIEYTAASGSVIRTINQSTVLAFGAFHNNTNTPDTNYVFFSGNAGTGSWTLNRAVVEGTEIVTNAVFVNDQDRGVNFKADALFAGGGEFVFLHRGANGFQFQGNQWSETGGSATVVFRGNRVGGGEVRYSIGLSNTVYALSGNIIVKERANLQFNMNLTTSAALIIDPNSTGARFGMGSSQTFTVGQCTIKGNSLPVGSYDKAALTALGYSSTFENSGSTIIVTGSSP